MQSSALESLSPRLRRSLAKLGTDIATARRKRNLTTMMMAERIGSARTTYLKVEKGDPSVSMGVYAMALFVLGFGDAIGDIIDPGRDEIGLLLDIERLPKRVRPKKLPTPAL
jgi:DNA-binding XRE family transcriptional regulator